MSRYVRGTNLDNFTPGQQILPNTGGTVSAVLSTSITPSSLNAVATKLQADNFAAGGSPFCNGVRVQSVMASQASGWYGHSGTVTCNWTVPSNTCRIFIQVWGGGGGGGGSRCRDEGNPGGAGGYAHGFFTVQPGDVIAIQAGRGGCRGCCFRHGCAGERSHACNATRGIQIRAYPGTGGLCSFNQYNGESGCYGIGNGGQLCLQGQREWSPTNCSCHRYCNTGRMGAGDYGAGPRSFGGYSAQLTGSTFMCQGTCGMPNCSPGGGGATTGGAYPGTRKGGAGGPGLVMIWH